MRREGGYLFVVTALIIGLGLGLLISLVISPVNYQNVSPSMLKPADKDLYRAMIALSFNARGDMGRAQARLGLLEDENPQVGLAAQAQQSIAQGKPAEEARSLALLAAALGKGPQPVVLPTEPVLTVPPSTPIHCADSHAGYPGDPADQSTPAARPAAISHGRRGVCIERPDE